MTNTPEATYPNATGDIASMVDDGVPVTINSKRNRRLNMDRDTANIIVDYIEVLEELANFNRVLEKLQEQGYTDKEVDTALKQLGEIARRDCGIL